MKREEKKVEPGKAIDIAKSIYVIKVVTAQNKDELHQTLILNEEQKGLADLFGF